MITAGRRLTVPMKTLETNVSRLDATVFIISMLRAVGIGSGAPNARLVLSACRPLGSESTAQPPKLLETVAASS